MKKLKEATIFPVRSCQDYNFIRLLIDEYDTISVYSDIESGLIGEDISFLVNRQPLKLPIQSVDSYTSKKNEDFYYLNICKYNDLQKIDKFHEKFSDIRHCFLNEFNNWHEFDFFQNEEAETFGHFIYNTRHRYYSIEVPVIIVCGIFELIDTDYIAMKLKKFFEKDGYKVSCITKNKEMGFLGAYSYPKNFFEGEQSVEEKIIFFNNYLRGIIEQAKTEILIINVPGGTIRYNHRFMNNFGIFAYMISQAASCDYGILSSIVGYDYYDQYVKFLGNKYHFNINAIHLSNIRVDISDNFGITKCGIGFLKELFIDDIIQQYNQEKKDYYIYNYYHENQCYSLYKQIVQELGG